MTSHATPYRPDEEARVFGDFAELEHVCYLLHEEADAAEVQPIAPHGMDVLNELRRRLAAQWQAHSDEIEAERPGLFGKTYMHHVYSETYYLVVKIGNDRRALVDSLGQLELLIHKVFVFSLRSQEDVDRAINSALEEVKPLADRGKAELARLSDMRAKASNSQKAVKYSDAAKQEWLDFDKENVASANRELNNSDRKRAVIKRFSLPKEADRTVGRALGMK
ncbi:MAG: hypothetical protein PHS77_08810 [Gallionellaceae bacterium]|nr:hypothetical protein [Gallionellaceae bacterium]